MAPRIHPTALIDASATLADDVSVGPYTVIHGNVRLGAGTVVGAFCELGHPRLGGAGDRPLVIGDHSLIRSHSVFYEGSCFGQGLTTGHRVTVREGTIAGDHLQLGTLCDVQGDCRFGHYSRLHSNVHIGQGSTVGDYVWLFPYVVLTNDPHPPSEVRLGVTVEDYAVVATMTVVLPGVTIGSGALVAAHSAVAKNVAADTVVAGAPAAFVRNADEIRLKDGSGRRAYPWRRHFHRGYLPAAVQAWIAEFGAAQP